MGCAASLSAKYLPAPKVEEGTSQASSSDPQEAVPPLEPLPQGPKKWTRTEMGQFTEPQLVRWLESLKIDLSSAISGEHARMRLWEEIQNSRPEALEQVTSLADLEYWPLPEMLRWLEYFDALDAKVAPKDKLIAMLLDHAEELPPPNFGEDAEATFLTEVQRHVTLVKQAATTIILQLSEVLLEAEAQREKHPWYANGKALTDFKASELKGAEEMNIQFIELQAGEEVDITIHETSGWAWVVKDDQQGWVPATAVTELAVALQDYAADESESVQCKEGDQFEVILRHYSGWTLCRRPKDSEGTPSKDAEGWLPDNCLSDHPRNLATKQQRLIQSGLHRLAADLNEVERTLLRIRTEGAGEEDSLQALHAKVCGLAEEYRQIVAVLQANPQLLGQEAQEATDSTAVQDEAIEGLPGLPGLPPWVRVEAQCYYVSKTQKKLMSVTVKRVCEVRRQVLVTFNADQNARKIVDFEAFEDMSNCPLQPKEKSHRKGRKRHAKNANANAEANLAEELRGLMQVLGPADDLSAPLSQSSDSESSYESDYTESTTSGGFERRASGRSAEQVSGSTVSLGLAPEGTMGANFSTSAMAEARRERAARQIQAAYRRFRTVSHPKESRGSSKELSKPPLAPLSPDRRAGAVCLVQSVLRGYLAKEGLQLLRWEAAAERQQAAQSIVAVMQRFQVQMDMLAFASLCRSVQMLQGAFRSHQCRLLLCTLASEQMLQRQAAALTLQTAQRGRAARRELARRRARRDGLLLLSPGKHRAIRQIQRCGLRYLACCVLREAERCRWCKARTIQANWRGHRCRRQWEDEMFKWRQSRQQAASRLQSMVRAVDAKKQLRQGTLMRSAAAQWIQTAWRRHRAVRRCSELRQKQRQLAAGLRIQSHWRGHVSRKSTTPILRRRQVAASRLQGMLRMARAREEVLRLREERQLTEFVAVNKIQSLMRSYQARKEVTPQLQERRRQHWASVKVQSSWRRQMAKAEAMKRRAQDVNQLLSSLLEGRPDETLRGDAWLQKVTAAFEWKTQRDVELEEKELRLRRQSAFSHLPSASFEELSRPESLSAAALLDRSMAAVCVAKQRARQRMKALLQTQAHGKKGLQSLIYDNEMCRSLAVDHGVLIRLNAEDGVAEVGNLLQTAWSIAFQLRSAAPIGGASPALHVLTSGIHSLKRKLRIEIQGAGKVEDSAALKSFMETAEEACNEAVHRATEARNATLQPLKEELEAALAESQVALKDLNGHISKVLPEVNAIKAKYKEDAVEAEAKLREEREMKHAQTVALNKIAICTQIEKERLEAGLVDKNKPKIACYKKVFANVKELQHELKDLEVSGTANRKSQGILQHTLRALESRAQKAENDSKGKVLFGDAEEDLKDFTPSEKVAQKQERGEEQELQFREALESEVQSLHADMEARAKFEAASRALARLVAWREAADPRRQWLAEVVPIARSCAQIRAAAEFIKVCKTPPEPPHSLGAALSAVQKQLGTLESQAERAASGAESPREGQLPQVFQKLQNALKALAELKVTYPDMPRSPHRNSPMAFLERKLYGREEEADAEATAEASEAEGSRSMSVSGAPPPFAPEEDASSKLRSPVSPVRRSSTSIAGKNLSIASLATLGKNLSALSALQPPSLPVPGIPGKSPSASNRPASATSPVSPGGSPDAAKAVPERSDKVTAPLRSPVRPSSASGPERRAAATVQRPTPGTSGSAMKAVQKARAVASGWE